MTIRAGAAGVDAAQRFYVTGLLGESLEPPSTVTLTQQFTASELLFGLRIYEPFRRWR